MRVTEVCIPCVFALAIIYTIDISKRYTEINVQFSAFFNHWWCLYNVIRIKKTSDQIKNFVSQPKTLSQFDPAFQKHLFILLQNWHTSSLAALLRITRGNCI